MKVYLIGGMVWFLMFLFSGSQTFGQNRIGTGEVRDLYQQHCVSCHGEDLRGGTGSSLVDDKWNHGESDEAIARVIREGLPDAGMEAYGEVLSEPEIRAMVIYIREKQAELAMEKPEKGPAPKEKTFTVGKTKFHLEKLAESDDIFWAADKFPDGRLLLTEIGGRLRIYEDGELSDPIRNTPDVVARGQGGLLEAGIHPDYAENGWIYLGYSHGIEKDGRTQAMTRYVRGRIKDGSWVDEEIIYEAPEKYYLPTSHHFGTRIVFKDGYIYFPIGDRGRKPMAQDLDRPNGKIHRLHEDGKVPEDNPFVEDKDALDSIWSYGHRNPQGLDIDPRSGKIWETEHGPRGGDELNHIRKGVNYGWPEITHGMNYNGTPITDKTHQSGMEQPVTYWVPSLAVCGIDFYEGDVFPEWTGDLFITGLSAQELRRLRIRDGKVTEQETIIKHEGRVRDVLSGPDGSLVVIINGKTAVGDEYGRLFRLVPEGK